MEDRELIELAAKAAGIKWVDDGAKGYWRHPEGHARAWWNPLTDDGDALRLAVKLVIDVRPPRNEDDDAMARLDELNIEVFEPQKRDVMSTTRRAIVCAAAEIGKAMP